MGVKERKSYWQNNRLLLLDEQRLIAATEALTFKAPITTKVICFSRVLKRVRSLYDKNSVGTDQTALIGAAIGAVWSGSTLFASILRFVSNVRQLFASVLYFHGDWLWNNFYGHSLPFRWLPLNHSWRIVVSCKRIYVHEVLVNCLFELTKEKVWLGELTVPPWP